MFAAGIIDPAKVTRSALQNAASIAGLFLTTEAVVADKPEKAAAPAGDPWAAWTSESAPRRRAPPRRGPSACSGGAGQRNRPAAALSVCAYCAPAWPSAVPMSPSALSSSRLCGPPPVDQPWKATAAAPVHALELGELAEHRGGL
jgi:hypothetical protein